jgi:GNAT superfamily N-acetyltransferase
MEIKAIGKLEFGEIQPLIELSQAEGYDFIQRLWDEIQQGVYDVSGAAVYGVYLDGQLIGIGGVHPDPYLKQAAIGRIRHVYVMENYRRTGTGRKLMDALMSHARGHFDVLTLRTPTAHADAFYRAMGFSIEQRFAEASHWIDLQASKI